MFTDISLDDAVNLQTRLRSRVVQRTPPGLAVRTVAGLDVGYASAAVDSAVDDAVVAVVVVLDADTLDVRDEVVVHATTTFPYVPGLFAFREMPSLLTALDKLSVTPDLLVCDGQGIAHPRRFGLACHIGVETGIPSIGVAKSPLGSYETPGDERGAWTDITLDDDVVGRALRTQSGVKPVFVSVGHLIDLDRACAEVLRLAPSYRLPETTRRADHLTRLELRELAP